MGEDDFLCPSYLAPSSLVFLVLSSQQPHSLSPPFAPPSAQVSAGLRVLLLLQLPIPGGLQKPLGILHRLQLGGGVGFVTLSKTILKPNHLLQPLCLPALPFTGKASSPSTLHCS